MADVDSSTAAEERDALLRALGFKPGPFRNDLSRKVILDDAAGLRPEMVKARRRADEAEADCAMWQWIAGDAVHDSRSGLLLRIWTMFREERSRRRKAEADSARLDFLDECNRRLNEQSGTSYGWKLVMNHNVNRVMCGHLAVDLHDSHGAYDRQPSCRLAIDERMKEIEHRRAAMPPQGASL